MQTDVLSRGVLDFPPNCTCWGCCMFQSYFRRIPVRVGRMQRVNLILTSFLGEISRQNPSAGTQHTGLNRKRLKLWDREVTLRVLMQGPACLLHLRAGAPNVSSGRTTPAFHPRGAAAAAKAFSQRGDNDASGGPSSRPARAVNPPNPSKVQP